MLCRTVNTSLFFQDWLILERIAPFLKIFAAGLAKLKRRTATIWRGIKGNVHKQYPAEKVIFWWNFSSCTTRMEVLFLPFYDTRRFNDQSYYTFPLYFVIFADFEQRRIFREKRQTNNGIKTLLCRVFFRDGVVTDPYFCCSLIFEQIVLWIFAFSRFERMNFQQTKKLRIVKYE